jgi:hypothetical protein
MVVSVTAVGGAAYSATAGASSAPDALVTSGSPAGVFPQNKQIEPTIARDPVSGVLIAGAIDFIDNEPCSQQSDGSGSCPFTNGVGDAGVYFSLDNGSSWIQPTYTGYSARTGTAVAGGPIGTLPRYYEAGLVTDGDPAVAVGPRPDASGQFSWSNGSRYYYADDVSNFPGSSTLETNFEAVAVSHTDDVAGAVAGHNSAWSAPSIASGRLNPVQENDKDALWADNAASSPYFGRVYASWTAFRGAEKSHTFSVPGAIMVAHSDDGGVTWSGPVQVSPAHDNTHNVGPQGSVIRTDSNGIVYVFLEGAIGTQSVQEMAISSDGGHTFSTPRPVAQVVDVGVFDSFAGQPVFDGFSGTPTNSFPSVDIANGAPTGQAATNRIVLGWSDARKGLGSEQALLQTSSDGGASWSSPVAVESPGDRPDFTAVAISPDGGTAYAVYDAFHGVYSDLSQPRPVEGVVVALNGNLSGPVTELHRGVTGDARAASSNSYVVPFIGDYNTAVASNDGVYAAWNDLRFADDCPAIDAWRTAFRSDPSTAPPQPYPPAACGTTSRFGNTDIFSGVFSR